jgi:hypothetical protein
MSAAPADKGTSPRVMNGATQAVPSDVTSRIATTTSGDCQDFRVWAGIKGKKEPHYVPTQRAFDPD